MPPAKTSVRLNEGSLQALPKPVRVPTYNRNELVHSILHIGVGGFHRAHQAVFLENLLCSGATRWGECGVGLLPQDSLMKEALAGQDHLYTVFTRGDENESVQVVGAITHYLHAPESPEIVLEQMAAPETRIVSLTVTEGGYYIDEGSGALMSSHPNLTYDLEHQQTPHTVLGYLAEALHRRQQRGLAPFTVLSCDNLPGNGDVIRKSLLGFAALRDDRLRNWIEQNVTFPNGMVDGITPITRDTDRAALQQNFGIEDNWPVVTEPFRQWVLEDHFCNGRPPWEEAGVQFTSDVAPYEKMKLRLLNAGHSALGYLGALRGLTYVHEAVHDATLHAFLEGFFREVQPLVADLPGMNVENYTAMLLQRFANPAIRDQLSRLCSEGSAKLPKFILPSIRELLKTNRPPKYTTIVIAAWLLYLSGRDEQGRPLPVIDARQEELQREDPTDLLKEEGLFGSLAATPAWTLDVRQIVHSLKTRGVEQTLRLL